MGIDKDLTRLDDGIRRLKIDYEMYFNGGSLRLPIDSHWHVEKLVQQYADSQKLNFAQRFRYKSLIQKLSSYNKLWLQKLKDQEKSHGSSPHEEIFNESVTRITCYNPSREPKKVDQLFKAIVEAKQKNGENIDSLDPLAFKKFVQDETKRLQRSLDCKKIQYVVNVEKGKVKLKAIRGES